MANADVNGNIVATYDYTPYGSIAFGTAPNGVGYTGHINDPETGLVYMQARYYDAATGHFLSVDPVSPDAGNAFNFNRYAYASNNPIRNLDPTGKSTCADANCVHSTIDAVLPRNNPQSPPVNGMEGIDSNSRVGLDIQGGYALRITFNNDDPNGKSPNQPLTTSTANMVESALSKSGVESANINSTTDGHHAENSRHYQDKAVDINKINGAKVSDAANKDAVKTVQDSFGRESNIRENFGPAYQQKTVTTGGLATPWPKVGEDHQNHIHESGQQ